MKETKWKNLHRGQSHIKKKCIFANRNIYKQNILKMRTHVNINETLQ